MNHFNTIMSLGLAIALTACSLTPPSPPLPDGEYRPVNKPLIDVTEKPSHVTDTPAGETL